jgi:hypothetical protein
LTRVPFRPRHPSLGPDDLDARAHSTPAMHSIRIAVPASSSQLSCV